MTLNYIRWITNSIHLWCTSRVSNVCCTCALWYCRVYFRFPCVCGKIVFPWASLILSTYRHAENVGCTSSVSHHLQISAWLGLSLAVYKKVDNVRGNCRSCIELTGTKMKSSSISMPHSLPHLIDIRLVRLRWYW